MPACLRCSHECSEEHRFCPSCGEELPTPASLRSDKLVGRTLPGGYVVQHLAGVGGMGRVYLAEQTALGRTVAVKFIHPHLVGDEHAAGRFITEARAASRLNHPNSIAILDFGKTDDGLLYLVMEYLRGKDLGSVAQLEGPLPIARVADIVGQILAALEEAHGLAIVHRDLKPQNVILEPLRSGRDFVKVVDYGLAKMRSMPRADAPITEPGYVCGTPEYMSPEQGRGDPLDARSDLYSVGVLLYQLLVGRLPFEGKDAMTVLLAHMREQPVDPRVAAPGRGIADALAEVVLRALGKDPDDRFSDARAFGDALRAATADLARRDTPTPRALSACVACGAPNLATHKFCGECGAPLRGSMRDAIATLAVTRASDFAWLLARREDARVMPAIARLVGREGAGKTRLVRDLARRSEPAFVIEAAAPCSEVSGHALRAAIAMLAGGSPAEWRAPSEATQRALVELFAPLERPADVQVDASDRRRAYADVLRWAVHRAHAREGAPIVLAFDDLDEMDGVSKNAVVDAIAAPPVAPVLWVVTYAHDPIGEGDAPGEVRVLEGAPLHLEEIARWRGERSDPPPPTLAELIAERIERLAPGPRWLLQAIAVLGDGVRDDVLRSAAPAHVDLAEARDALAAAGVIDGGRIAHPLFRRMAIASAPLGVRTALHASALAADVDGAMAIELRAHHARHAGAVFEALVLYERVADERAARGDQGGAVLALRAAIDLVRREGMRGELVDPLRAFVHFSRGLADALVVGEAYADAEGVLREALDLAPPNDPDRAHVLGSLAQVAHKRARQLDAQSYLREAIRIARRSDAHELLSSLESIGRAIAS